MYGGRSRGNFTDKTLFNYQLLCYINTNIHIHLSTESLLIKERKFANDPITFARQLCQLCDCECVCVCGNSVSTSSLISPTVTRGYPPNPSGMCVLAANTLALCTLDDNASFPNIDEYLVAYRHSPHTHTHSHAASASVNMPMCAFNFENTHSHTFFSGVYVAHTKTRAGARAR